MLKCVLYLKKIVKNNQAMGAEPWHPLVWLGLYSLTPAILPSPTILLQNVLILSLIKKSILMSKIWSILVLPLFVIAPLHGS